MTQKSSHIPLISGWKVLAYQEDGITLIIPDGVTLRELIVMPNADAPDPNNLAKYRSTQVFRPDNQKLLQIRSNALVNEISRRWESPSDYEIATQKWCLKNNVSYQLVLYARNLMEYCQQILVDYVPNPEKNKAVTTQMSSVLPPGDTIFYDNEELRKKIEESERSKKITSIQYFDKQQRFHASLERRFSEYYKAKKILLRLYIEHGIDDAHRYAYFNEADRIDKENSKQEILKRTGELENRILSQCIFCYAFWLQKSKNRLSRCCDQDECKLINQAWAESLKPHRKNIDIKTVPTSGF